MFDLQDLYQEVIVDHNKHPRNFRRMDDANRTAEGFNPLCGDRLNIYLKVIDDVIQDVSFEASGCAISVASASLMTQQLKGKTGQEAETLFHNFQDMMTADSNAPVDTEKLGKLAALAGVRRFPMRVKCATLCWHTLNAARKQETRPATTE